jgi:hypothetical protein
MLVVNAVRVRGQAQQWSRRATAEKGAAKRFCSSPTSAGASVGYSPAALRHAALELAQTSCTEQRRRHCTRRPLPWSTCYCRVQTAPTTRTRRGMLARRAAGQRSEIDEGAASVRPGHSYFGRAHASPSFAAISSGLTSRCWPADRMTPSRIDWESDRRGLGGRHDSPMSFTRKDRRPMGAHGRRVTLACLTTALPADGAILAHEEPLLC